MIKEAIEAIHPLVGTALQRNDVEPKQVITRHIPSRSPDQIRVLVTDNYDFLWRSLRRLGVPAPSVEDAAQQVLLVFGQRVDGIYEGAERAFLFSTATRVAADYRKKQVRSREVFDPDAVDASVHPSTPVDQLLDQARARDLLDVVLAEMPLELRAVFILFEFEEMTMAAIAQTLELPPGTVASRLRRARETFDAAARQLQSCRRNP